MKPFIILFGISLFITIAIGACITSLNTDQERSHTLVIVILFLLSIIIIFYGIITSSSTNLQTVVHPILAPRYHVV